MPYLLPEIFSMNSIIGMLITILKICNALFLIVKFAGKHDNRFSTVFILVEIYQAIAFFSGMRFGIVSWSILLQIAICFIFHYGMTYEADYMLEALLFICDTLIIINFVTMILFPDGLYTIHTAWQTGNYELNWFLGYKNTMIRFILPTCMFELIQIGRKRNMELALYKRTLKKSLLILAISVASILMSRSSNGILGIALFVLLIILLQKDKIRGFITPIKAYIMSILLTIFIVIMRAQSYFSYLIDVILKRDVTTMGGRTVIWEKAIQIFTQHPIIGCGEYAASLLNSVGVSHAHNYFLNILVNSGIIGFIFFTALIFTVSHTVRKCDNRYFVCSYISCICCIFVMALVESLTSTLILPTIMTGSYGISLMLSHEKQIDLKNKSYII